MTRTELIAMADRQARAHGLDPADESVRGLVRNLLTVVLAAFEEQRHKLAVFHEARRKLQLSVNRGDERATVFSVLAQLERELDS